MASVDRAPAPAPARDRQHRQHRQRVVLHVGVPKSGTTFLQAGLLTHAEALAQQGVLYPQTDDGIMFRAALDVRGTHKAWGRTRAEVEGAWDDLCRQAWAHPGTTVISHELLAAAGKRQVDSALSMLRGLDVQVVVTARDPARQLTAEWQEGIKHGRRSTFAEFQSRIEAALPEDGLAQHFHAVQDLPDVLARWGRHLPAEQVHVVVAPPPGGARRLLWQHFGEAAGLDVTGLEPADGGAANRSLGTAEIDLLRRVNIALGGRLPQPRYGALVKHEVAQRVLAAQGSPAPQPPPSVHDQAAHLAEQWVKQVERAGYTVHGTLHDLVPRDPGPDAGSAPHPDEVDPADQLIPAAEVIADLLLQLHRAQTELADQTAKRRDWKRRAKKARRTLAERGG